MSPIVRRVSCAVVALLLLLAAGAVALVASFDEAKLKAFAIDSVATRYQRTLTLAGPLSLRIFPRLQLQVTDAALSEVGSDQIFATLDRASLSVDLLPLWRGDIVVGRVAASGVRASWRRDAQGHSNVDDLLDGRPASSSADAAAPTPAATPAVRGRLDVRAIDLEDVRLTVADALGPASGDIAVSRLTTGRLGDGSDSPFRLVARIDLKQPLVQGDINADARLALDAATRSLRLRDATLRYQGDLPGAAATDLRIQGHWTRDGSTGVVEGERLSVDIAGLAGGVRWSDSRLTLEKFSHAPATGSILLADLQARLAGTLASASASAAAGSSAPAATPLTVVVDWPALSADPNTLTGSPVSGQLTAGGATPVKLDFRSKAPQGNLQQLRLPGFEATLASEPHGRTLTAALGGDLTWRNAARELSLDALSIQAVQRLGPGQPLSVRANGSAMASAQAARWQLAGDIDRQAFELQGTLNHVGAPPQMQLQGRFAVLDLGRWMPSTAAPSRPSRGATPPAADTPVDLSALRSVNGRLDLRAERLMHRQMTLSDVHAVATLNSGMLRVERLNAGVWGGRLEATGLADARASRVAVQGLATGIDVNAMLRDTTQVDALEGRGRVKFDLDTAGRSKSEMTSRLQGEVAMQLRDGAVKGVNLAKSFRQAQAAITRREDAQERSAATEKTDFSELAVSFQVKDGVAHSRDLDAKSPLLRLGGDGRIDLIRNQVDYLARATVAATSKGQDGAELTALRGLTVPLHLTGPLDAIGWKIQWSGVAADALGRRLEERLSDRLGRTPVQPDAVPGGADSARAAAEKVLKDKLKGLFK